MVSSIHIGFRHCGKRTISVIVDYSIKSRQLNPTTVIVVINVELLMGVKLKIIGFYVFSYPSPRLPMCLSTIFWKDLFGKFLSQILF